jgi:hypothetical protein
MVDPAGNGVSSGIHECTLPTHLPLGLDGRKCETTRETARLRDCELRVRQSPPSPPNSAKRTRAPSHLTLHSRARNRSAEAGSKALNNSIFLAAVCRKSASFFYARHVAWISSDLSTCPTKSILPSLLSRNKGLGGLGAGGLGQSSPKAGQRKNGCTDSTSIWNRR